MGHSFLWKIKWRKPRTRQRWIMFLTNKQILLDWHIFVLFFYSQIYNHVVATSFEAETQKSFLIYCQSLWWRHHESGRFPAPVLWSPRTAVTKYYKLAGLNNRNESHHSSGDHESKIKVLTRIVFCKGCEEESTPCPSSSMVVTWNSLVSLA